jgi:death on curing protein
VSSTRYPSLEEALYLHERILETSGGSPGVRDLGLLDSALARPRSGYYESLSLQASALLHSLCGNHAFVDGNKRMAFALTDVFLRLNGYKIVVSADEGERFIVHDVIEGRAPIEQICAWLEERMRPR